MRSINSLLLLIVISLMIGAEADNPVLKLKQAINNIKPFRVNFIQQVIEDDLIEIEESGEILYFNQTLLKWTYLKPDYKIFVLNGNKYSYYDKEENQVTRGKIKEKGQQWIWQHLFSEEFKDQVKFDDLKRLFIFKDKTSDLDLEVYIDKKFLPNKIIQTTALGGRNVYYLTNYQPRVRTSNKDFNLSIPQGVELVEVE